MAALPGESMTEDDMVSERERIVLSFSRNEETIQCVMARLNSLSVAIQALNRRPIFGADKDCGRIAEILEGRDIREDVNDLQDALAQRPVLVEQLRAHGLSHIKRGSGPGR